MCCVFLYNPCQWLIFSFRKKSGFSFSEMLFFDDETRNTIEVGRHGILSVLVENGITKRVVEEGLAEFASKRSD